MFRDIRLSDPHPERNRKRRRLTRAMGNWWTRGVVRTPGLARAGTVYAPGHDARRRRQERA